MSEWGPIFTLLGAVVGGAISLAGTYLMWRLQHRSEFMAERTARRLLSHRSHIWRSFAAIQNELGGFEGDALRQILVRAGARRSFRKGDRSDPKNEWWMLVSRMDEWLRMLEAKKEKRAAFGAQAKSSPGTMPEPDPAAPPDGRRK